MALADIHLLCLDYCRHEAAQARPAASVNLPARKWAVKRLGQEVYACGELGWVGWGRGVVKDWEGKWRGRPIEIYGEVSRK